MSDSQPDIAEIDARIADIKENLRELIEQAAAYSGAADDERLRSAAHLVTAVGSTSR